MRSCQATIADTARTDQAAVNAARESMQREIDGARTALANARCRAPQARWLTASGCGLGARPTRGRAP